MIELRYDSTWEDEQQAVDRLVLQTLPTKKLLATSIIIPLFPPAFMTYVVYLDLDQNRDTLSLIVYGIVFTCLLAPTAWFYLPKNRQQLFRNKLLALSLNIRGDKNPIPVALRLNEYGTDFEWTLFRMQRPWSQATEISNDNYSILIRWRDTSMLSIPNHAFDSDAARQQCIDYITKRIEAAQTPPTAPKNI